MFPGAQSLGIAAILVGAVSMTPMGDIGQMTTCGPK